ncbi:MAG: hypothetical protein JSS09_05275, partial [Verrucomicrobia bacterium]|nr:hypothetical protein [Verrucomicrobiota bacterium]
DVLENKASLKASGFTILYNQPSGMQVAKHPLLPGYLIKAYFNSNNEHKGLQWAIDRCLGAKNIRNLIKEENLQYFTVPDKWIYLVSYPNPTIAVLLVEDMGLVSKEETKKAWKNANKKQLKELHIILSHGFGSCYLSGNAPYTRKGKFAYVDTAYPYREYDSYERMKRYFSPEMQQYWDKIVKEGKKNK